MVLIKSVFNSLPLYWFQIYRVPSCIRESLDKIRRSFFWEEIGHKYAQDRKKLHLINWDLICLPKHKGGLGVGNLKARNQALLLKWWWRWYKDRGNWWWKVLKEKYNIPPHLGMETCTNRRDISYVMRAICSVQKESWWISHFSNENFAWKVGNGKLVYFWEDTWCLERPLAIIYPRLYALSKLPNHTVEEFLNSWRNNGDCI